jgi:amino acid transporter
MSRPKVFVREATGLVKDIGTLDAFWMNLYANNPMVAGYYVFILAPALFVGGDLLIATFLAALGTIAVGIVYSLATATMPRSGGDYVFVSRTFYPAVGFFSNFNLSYWVFAFWGFNAFLTVTFLGSLATDMGQVDLSSWLGTPNGLFVAGSLVSILGCLLMVGRLRYYLALQRVVAIYALIVAAAVVVILLSGAGHFHQVFNQWAIANQAVNGTDPYQTVLQTAKSQGFLNPGFSWSATSGVVVVMWAASLTAWWSSWVSGEMKNAQRVKNQMLAIVGSAAITGLILGAIAFALINTVGYDFFGSLVYSVSSFPAMTSNYIFYVRLFAPSYMIFIDLGFVLSVFILIPMDILFTTRCMFAWSFDRLLPSTISKVSDRFHTPVISILISFVIAEFLIYLFAFTNAVGLYAATTFGVMVTYLITAIAVTVFPYVRKKTYDASPAKYNVGGVPLMTVAGIISILFMIFLTYYYVTVPGLAGFSFVTLETIIVLFIAALVIFFGARSYHRSKGLELEMAFKEIPPE